MYVWDGRMAKLVRMPLTKARSRLFELANLVRQAADDTTVVFEQRGHSEGVALVREARLKYLEDRVMQMDKDLDKPFTLAGSLSSPLDDQDLEQVLKALRKAWTPAAGKGP
jgi:hypothetical protein